MELITASTHKVTILYVDELGNITTNSYDVECYINVPGNLTGLWESLCFELSNITYINGISNITQRNNNSIITDEFSISYHDNKLVHHQSMMPYMGSIQEVVQRTLELTMCSMMATVGNHYSTCNVTVNSTNDENTLNLIIFDENGVSLRVGKLDWVFDTTRSVECPSCMDGYIKFKEIITMLNKTPIVVKGDFNYSGNIITDMNVSSDSAIEKELYTTFFPIITKAKIAKLKYTSTLLHTPYK